MLREYRNNHARPISVTFATRDDKESFMSNKHHLPTGIYVNGENPLHVKHNRDKLRPILCLAKSLLQYRDKNKLVADKLIINGTSYSVNDIPTLPPDLAAYKAPEQMIHVLFLLGNSVPIQIYIEVLSLSIAINTTVVSNGSNTRKP